MECKLTRKFLLFTLAALILETQLHAQCIGLVKGPIVFDVSSCKDVVPKDDFNKKADFSFYNGMTPEDKARFMAQYKGLFLRGKVVKSEAVQTGLDTKKGALIGNNISAFIAGGALQCSAIEKKRISVQVNEVCCAGGVDAPCLLDTPYTFMTPSVIGLAGSAAGDQERMAATKSESYKKAIQAFQKKDYKEAAKLFEDAKKKNELDASGYFYLGLTYRNLDECKKAIPVLQVVYDRSAKKDVWADQEKMVRRSNFLLARCLAKTDQPGRATIILNSYLIEPKKYRAEIKESLKNPDFGRINASKEYRQYVEAANKKLRGKRGSGTFTDHVSD